MPGEIPFFHQAAEMVLQRVAAGAGGADHVGHRDAAVLADVVDDLEVQLGQGGNHYPLALHLGRQPALLLLQGPQKKDQPRLPVRRGGADSALRLAQRQVVALFAVLDHAFQRTVGHIGVPGLQQEERGEHTAQAAVAVLEGVDFKKHNRKDGDDEQRMEPLQFLGLPEPSDKLGHQPRRVEGRGGLEDDGNLLAGVVEGGDTVGQRLVLAAVPVVLLAVAAKGRGGAA